MREGGEGVVGACGGDGRHRTDRGREAEALAALLPEMGADMRFLLRACGPTDGGEGAQAAARKDPDWERIAQRAVGEKVFPLVHRYLATEGLAHVAEGRLGAAARLNARRSFYMSGVLLKVLGALRDNGILAVPLKGPVLAESLYGDAGLRAFSDLDILVDSGEGYRSIRVLEALGYVPEVALCEEAFPGYARSEDNLTLRAGGVKVEVHWELSGRSLSRPYTLETLRHRLVEATVLGRPVPGLSAEDLMVYLALHGSRHRWANLDQVLSVAGIPRRYPSLDWRRATAIADGLGCGRCLLLGALLAHALFHAAIPSPLLASAMGDRGVAEAARRTLARLAGGIAPVTEGPDALGGAAFLLRLLSGRWEKLAFLLRFLFRPSKEDWKFWALPPRAAFMRYLLRPVRLGAEGLRRVVGA